MTIDLVTKLRNSIRNHKRDSLNDPIKARRLDHECSDLLSQLPEQARLSINRRRVPVKYQLHKLAGGPHSDQVYVFTRTTQVTKSGNRSWEVSESFHFENGQLVIANRRQTDNNDHQDHTGSRLAEGTLITNDDRQRAQKCLTEMQKAIERDSARRAQANKIDHSCGELFDVLPDQLELSVNVNGVPYKYRFSKDLLRPIHFFSRTVEVPGEGSKKLERRETFHFYNRRLVNAKEEQVEHGVTNPYPGGSQSQDAVLTNNDRKEALSLLNDIVRAFDAEQFKCQDIGLKTFLSHPSQATYFYLIGLKVAVGNFLDPESINTESKVRKTFSNLKSLVTGKSQMADFYLNGTKILLANSLAWSATKAVSRFVGNRLQHRIEGNPISRNELREFAGHKVALNEASLHSAHITKEAAQKDSVGELLVQLADPLKPGEVRLLTNFTDQHSIKRSSHIQSALGVTHTRELVVIEKAHDGRRGRAVNKVSKIRSTKPALKLARIFGRKSPDFKKLLRNPETDIVVKLGVIPGSGPGAPIAAS